MSNDVHEQTGYGEKDSLLRLWAPYRMHYIEHRPKGDENQDPFLDAPKHDNEQSLIVARGKTVYCLLNLYPYNAGHLLVVPYRQVADLEDLKSDEATEMMTFITKGVRTLKKASQPSGINVGFNLGNGSGGSVRDHLHAHIVPRWPGDANFLTVLSGTKVLPRLLGETRELLAETWAEIELKEGER